MMKMSLHVLRILATPVCALAVCGCAAWTDYAETTPAAGPQERLQATVWRDQCDPSPLHFEVTAEPTTLGRGEAMTVSTTLVNALDVPVGVQFANGCTGGWSLWSEHGCVAVSEHACTQATVTRVYPPGRGPTGSFTWVWDRASIAPGTYRFVAGLGPDGTMDGGEVIITLVERDGDAGGRP